MQSMGCSSNRLNTPATVDAICVSDVEKPVLDDVDAATVSLRVLWIPGCCPEATEQMRSGRIALSDTKRDARAGQNGQSR